MSKTQPTSTLIINTYNWPAALQLVLKSLLIQKQMPDEVVIADDGSTDETRILIEKFTLLCPVPVIHVWQADDGFRKSEALNKSLARASGDYIIHLDGDCIMHPGFVGDHLSMAQQGLYLFGSRVNIKKSFLEQLVTKQKIRFSPFSRGIYKRGRALYFPAMSLRGELEQGLSIKLRGCNLSHWRADAIAVNGYNEGMTGWGREDSEFVVRLANLGIKGQRLRHAAIIYHIYHQELPRDSVTANDAIQQQAIDKKITRCDIGLDKYL
jgi:glycosyltransferase involved in cell wall biosynthesis